MVGSRDKCTTKKEEKEPPAKGPKTSIGGGGGGGGGGGEQQSKKKRKEAQPADCVEILMTFYNENLVKDNGELKSKAYAKVTRVMANDTSAGANANGHMFSRDTIRRTWMKHQKTVHELLSKSSNGNKRQVLEENIHLFGNNSSRRGSKTPKVVPALGQEVKVTKLANGKELHDGKIYWKIPPMNPDFHETVYDNLGIKAVTSDNHAQDRVKAKLQHVTDPDMAGKHVHEVLTSPCCGCTKQFMASDTDLNLGGIKRVIQKIPRMELRQQQKLVMELAAKKTYDATTDKDMYPVPYECKNKDEAEKLLCVCRARFLLLLGYSESLFTAAEVAENTGKLVCIPKQTLGPYPQQQLQEAPLGPLITVLPRKVPLEKCYQFVEAIRKQVNLQAKGSQGFDKNNSDPTLPPIHFYKLQPFCDKAGFQRLYDKDKNQDPEKAKVCNLGHDGDMGYPLCQCLDYSECADFLGDMRTEALEHIKRLPQFVALAIEYASYKGAITPEQKSFWTNRVHEAAQIKDAQEKKGGVKYIADELDKQHPGVFGGTLGSMSLHDQDHTQDGVTGYQERKDAIDSCVMLCGLLNGSFKFIAAPGSQHTPRYHRNEGFRALEKYKDYLNLQQDFVSLDKIHKAEAEFLKFAAKEGLTTIMVYYLQPGQRLLFAVHKYPHMTIVPAQKHQATCGPQTIGIFYEMVQQGKG